MNPKGHLIAREYPRVACQGAHRHGGRTGRFRCYRFRTSTVRGTGGEDLELRVAGFLGMSGSGGISLAAGQASLKRPGAGGSPGRGQSSAASQTVISGRRGFRFARGHGLNLSSTRTPCDVSDLRRGKLETSINAP